MKFKINKINLDLLKEKIGDDFEIELELVPNTASEAMIHQNLRNTFFNEGYHYGFQEGYHEGRKSLDYGCHFHEFDLCPCGCTECRWNIDLNKHCVACHDYHKKFK